MNTESLPAVQPAVKYHSRIIAHRGADNFSLPVNQVALFYTENRVTRAIDKTERRFICDQTLSAIENTVDPYQFFRVNRQYLVNIDAIRSYKTYEKVKLELKLNLPGFTEVIIISQDTAPLFKKWMQAM
jgi:DNA-binding LytR/AlgR family response regulator